MNLGPFDVLPLRQLLRDSVPALVEVYAVGTLAEAQQSQMPAPSAFVLLADEQAQPRAGGSGVYRQRVTATVGVLLALPYFGAEASQGPETRAVIQACRQALVGHRPAGAETVLQLTSGRLIGEQQSALLWLERYRCDYWIDR